MQACGWESLKQRYSKQKVWWREDKEWGWWQEAITTLNNCVYDYVFMSGQQNFQINLDL